MRVIISKTTKINSHQGLIKWWSSERVCNIRRQWRTEAIMVLTGGSQCCQVPVSISKRIKANCHLPLTLPPKEGDTDNQASFWYTLSAKTSLEWKILISHHPSLVRQKAISTVLAMASRFSQLAVCCCHYLWSTLVFSRFHLSWWSVIPSGPLVLPTNAKRGGRSPKNQVQMCLH